MKNKGRVASLFLLIPITCFGNETDVARAYLQAVTGGSGPRVAQSVDYDALGCNPRTVWEDNCQQAVMNGKDGKTLFMESITPVASSSQWRASNVTQLLPEENLRAAFANRLAIAQQLFSSLSTEGNGWFAGMEGDGNAKSILRAYIQHVSSGVNHGEPAGNVYTSFSGDFARRTPEDLRATAAEVDLRIDVFDKARPMGGLYFWALQVSMTDMQYPEGYADVTDGCRNSTTAWGHVGLQYHAESGRKAANWGGGGQGDGTADYGCGGSNVSDFEWENGTWYRMSVFRGEQVGEKLWKWYGTIEGGEEQYYEYAIHGGEYLIPHGFVVWTEAINLYCEDPPAIVSWGQPLIMNDDGEEFEIETLNASYSTDKACATSNQTLLENYPAVWTQEMGAGIERRTPNNTNLLTAPSAPSPPEISVN